MDDKNNQEGSQNCEILPHDHNLTGGNLTQVGTRHKAVRDGIGMVIGFNTIRVFRCRICTMDIERVDPNIFPPGDYS